MSERRVMISRSCSSAAIGCGSPPGHRSRPSEASCRCCEADADALAGDPDLYRGRCHGLAAVDRWTVRTGARAVGAGSTLRPSLPVSQSARRPAEGAGLAGFWVLYKRLERGTFAWPTEESAGSVEMRSADLALLLAGVDIARTRRRRWYERVA